MIRPIARLHIKEGKFHLLKESWVLLRNTVVSRAKYIAPVLGAGDTTMHLYSNVKLTEISITKTSDNDDRHSQQTLSII